MNEELLIKYLLKETSAAENVQVKSWLEESEENEKEYQRLKLIWESSQALSVKQQQDADQAWERFKVRRDGPKEAVIKPMHRSFPWLKVAAVFLLALTATWFYVRQQGAVVTLASGNEVSQELLPDGSTLTLNKHSVITYASFDSHVRQIKLEEGEVFCEVKPDKSRPFIIHANEVKIEVLGTSFNVKHIGQQTEVIVATGKVSVSTKGGKVDLQAGEKVLVRANSNVLQKTDNPDQLYRYYQNKEFVADNIPLERVVEVLNEAYSSNIVVEGERLKKATLNATFKDEPLEKILEVISETFHAKIIKRDGQIILKEQ